MNGRVYRPALDWLKAIGMILILLGHLAGAYTNHLSPPIYQKQLGVAFFVFAMGYSLGVENRPRMHVLWNRLFEVVLFGLATAIVVSACQYATTGRLALSNYLPLALGANIVINDFPANPTTWYIGTYIHLLLLWCAIRPLRMSWRIMAVAVIFEVVCRSVLATFAGLFIAYMAFPNWLSVFLAGIWAAQRDWRPRTAPMTAVTTAVALGGLVYICVWPYVDERSFPFMIMTGESWALAIPITSCLISALYLAWTMLATSAFWDVRSPAAVRFIARNTIVIFIGHMPLFFWINPQLTSIGLTYDERAIVLVFGSLIGLGAVSELLHCILPIAYWRDELRSAVLPENRQHALPT